jgi:hypothetical protein
MAMLQAAIVPTLPTTWLDVAKWTVPVAVAVLGWFASHVLAIRAQKKAFRYQLLDRVRAEIVKEVRAYQRWLDECVTRASQALRWYDLLENPAASDLFDEKAGHFGSCLISVRWRANGGSGSGDISTLEV